MHWNEGTKFGLLLFDPIVDNILHDDDDTMTMFCVAKLLCVAIKTTFFSRDSLN